MVCITADVARKQSDYVLEKLSNSGVCIACAIEAHNELIRRSMAKAYKAPYHVLFGVEEMKSNDTDIRGSQPGVSESSKRTPKHAFVRFNVTSNDLIELTPNKASDIEQLSGDQIDGLEEAINKLFKANSHDEEELLNKAVEAGSITLYITASGNVFPVAFRFENEI